MAGSLAVGIADAYGLSIAFSFYYLFLNRNYYKWKIKENGSE